MKLVGKVSGRHKVPVGGCGGDEETVTALDLQLYQQGVTPSTQSSGGSPSRWG